MSKDEFIHLFPSLSDSLSLCFLCMEKHGFIGNKIIWGNGRVGAKLMVVGMDSGKPAYGDSIWRGSIETRMPLTNENTGLTFRKLLYDVGIKKHHVFITNIVKCNTGRNLLIEKGYHKEDVFKKLSEVCISYLENEIIIIEPKVIITLGKDVQEIIDNSDLFIKINDLKLPDMECKPKGSPKPFMGKLSSSGFEVNIFNLYHPSYLSRKPSQKEEMENKCKEALCIIKRFI